MKYIQRKSLEEIDSYISCSPNEKDSQLYILSTADSSVSSKSDESALYNLKKGLGDWMKEVFLPRGYPHSVSNDYLEYQIWDSFQAYCSNLSGALSLHSTLIGIGVGQDTASPLAAAISWLTKDGAGMVSSITFAYYKGCDLDNNSKQWRLFADVVNDGAHFIKLLAPILPLPFLVTFCIASVMSSLVGVAGGATRTSLIQHQALCNNMADVAAKDGSQETLVNLAGLLTSLTLLPLLTSNAFITWMSFLTFVGLHLFSNYKAMRSLKMKTLNRPRLLYVFDHLTTRASVPDVNGANESEPLFLGPAFIQDYLGPSYKLEVGVSINYVKKCFTDAEDDFKHMFITQSSHFEKTKYMIFLHEATQRVFIIYHQQSVSINILESFWCSYLCAINLSPKKEGQLCKEYEVNFQGNIQDFILKNLDIAQLSFKKILPQLEAKGWQVDPIRIKVEEWRLMPSK